MGKLSKEELSKLLEENDEAAREEASIAMRLRLIERYFEELDAISDIKGKDKALE